MRDLHDSPWHAAAYRNDVQAMARFLELGQDIEERAYDNVNTVVEVTALLVTTNQGHANAVRYLLDSGADIENANEYGATALMHAAYHGHSHLVELLVESGANVNASSSTTALSSAVQSGNKKTVVALLQRGARVNLKDETGRTALDWAEDLSNQEIYALLLAASD